MKITDISLPYDLLVILWNYGGCKPSTTYIKRFIMKRKLVEQFELVALVSIFISSVYAISPLV